jgi:pSer/pThr/pTyr-binding forkhead associated (FHA) protein
MTSPSPRPSHLEASPESTGGIGPELRASLRDDLVAVSPADVEDIPVLGRNSGLLVVKRGPNVGSQFVLHQPVATTGRHPASDIFLDDITVSRRHAEFRREHGQFRVVDLGSLNGVYLNRELVESAVLANGDEIQIGNFRLIFLTGPAPGVVA